jgi:RHS repeat-associated protein
LARRHSAFGYIAAQGGSTPSPFPYCGREGYQTDHDRGLQLLGNRYYDPAIGRFLTRDPAEAGDNVNLLGSADHDVVEVRKFPSLALR